jgi:capsular exopolysaccharide synthesis family protein
LLITRPGPAVVKTTVAANLAVILAQAGRRVTLLDADLRRPRIHRLVGMPNRNGLADAFMHTTEGLNGIVRAGRIENLGIVTSGSLPPNPAELLGSQRMQEILKLLSERVDTVILDSPPAGVVTDAIILASQVDGVLLVVEPKHTRIGAADRAVDQLRRSGANLIGVVVNNIRLDRFAGHNDYYYPYLYSYVAKNIAARRKRRKISTAKPKSQARAAARRSP